MAEQDTFWGHLEALRLTLLKMLAAATVLAVAAFCLKDWLFGFVLWPLHSDFPTYRALDIEAIPLQLINTQLTEQFMAHIKVAFVAGVVAASPYLVYALFSFVAPALYENELRVSKRLIAASYLASCTGMAVNYLIVFPLTVRFLGSYRVSAEVVPMLTLSGYIDTLLVMSLAFGMVFEMPVVAWLMGHFGLLKSEWMSRYRRHAIVAILIVAAVITPTTDMITLSVVALPIWLLYEVSILLVPKTACQPPA